MAVRRARCGVGSDGDRVTPGSAIGWHGREAKRNEENWGWVESVCVFVLHKGKVIRSRGRCILSGLAASYCRSAAIVS